MKHDEIVGPVGPLTSTLFVERGRMSPSDGPQRPHRQAHLMTQWQLRPTKKRKLDPIRFEEVVI